MEKASLLIVKSSAIIMESDFYFRVNKSLSFFRKRFTEKLNLMAFRSR